MSIPGSAGSQGIPQDLLMMVNDVSCQLWEHPAAISIIAIHKNLQIVEREVKGMHVVLGREV